LTRRPRGERERTSGHRQGVVARGVKNRSAKTIVSDRMI
jgi:hypothetical protein